MAESIEEASIGDTTVPCTCVKAKAINQAHDASLHATVSEDARMRLIQNVLTRRLRDFVGDAQLTDDEWALCLHFITSIRKMPRAEEDKILVEHDNEVMSDDHCLQEPIDDEKFALRPFVQGL